MQKRYDALAEKVLTDVVEKPRLSGRVDDSRWELGLIAFFEICRFSELNETEAALRVIAFWKAGLAQLGNNNAVAYNTWGDAIVAARFSGAMCFRLRCERNH
jgi:hypothetical protein